MLDSSLSGAGFAISLLMTVVFMLVALLCPLDTPDSLPEEALWSSILLLWNFSYVSYVFIAAESQFLVTFNSVLLVPCLYFKICPLCNGILSHHRLLESLSSKRSANVSCSWDDWSESVASIISRSVPTISSEERPFI